MDDKLYVRSKQHLWAFGAVIQSEMSVAVQFDGQLCRAHSVLPVVPIIVSAGVVHEGKKLTRGKAAISWAPKTKWC